MSRNVPLKRVGKNYTLKEHDSLYICGNKFVWYSRDKKGNSIDFFQLFYGMDFKTAVFELTGQCITETNNERRVISYLCKKRDLKSEFVLSLIKRCLLHQNSRGNVAS